MIRLKSPTPPINKKVSRSERGKIVETRCGQIFSVGEKLITTMDIIGNKTINAIGTTNKIHPQLEGRLAGFSAAKCFVCVSIVITSKENLK